MGRLSVFRVAVFLAAMASRAQPAPDYARDIRPILAKYCYACHSGERMMGGIRLDARAGAFGKGDSGHVTIAPGDSSGSELIRRVTSTEKNRMPFGAASLAPAQVGLLRAWIDAGALWPEAAADSARDLKRPEMLVTEKDRQHWAFR